jgi:hypothetical protein
VVPVNKAQEASSDDVSMASKIGMDGILTCARGAAKCGNGRLDE